MRVLEGVRSIAAVAVAALVCGLLVALPSPAHAADLQITIAGDRVRVIEPGPVPVSGTSTVAVGGSLALELDGVVQGSVQVAGDGTWQGAVDLTGAAEGRHLLWVRDAASGVKAYVSFLVRPSGSAVVMQSPASGDVITSSTGHVITLVATLPQPPGGSGTVVVESAQAFAVSGGFGSHVTVDRATGLLRASISAVGLANGPQVLGLWLPCDWDGAPTTQCGVATVSVTLDLTTSMASGNASYDTMAARFVVTLNLTDAGPDTDLSFTVAGREFAPLGGGEKWFAYVPVFPTPGAPSWLPGSGTYPVTAHGTSRGRAVSWDVAQLEVDLVPRLELVDPPRQVMAKTDIAVPVRVHNVAQPAELTVTGPMSPVDSLLYSRSDGSATLHLRVGGKVGPGTVTVSVPALDGSILRVTFDVVVNPYDVDGPWVYWEGGGTGLGAGETTFRRTATTLRWVAWDVTGIAGHQVRERRFPTGTTAPAYSTALRELPAGTRSLAVPFRSGTTSCWQVRGIDVLGHVGAWSGDTCVSKAVDDRSFAIKHDAQRRHSSSALGGSVTILEGSGRIVLPGARSGQLVQIRGRSCAGCGPVKVRLGNGPWTSVFLPSRHELAASGTAWLGVTSGARSYSGRLVIKQPAGGGTARIDAVLLS